MKIIIHAIIYDNNISTKPTTTTTTKTLTLLLLPPKISKIHSKLYERSRFDGNLTKFTWRVDLKTSSRDQAELHEPTAIIEMVGGGGEEEGDGEEGAVRRPVLFEMSREEVQTTLKTLRHIAQLMASQS